MMGIDTERSGPHRTAERWARELGIGFVTECRDFPPYLIDLYLPEWHLGVEIDGPYHTPKQDALRDADLLLRYGLMVERVTTKGITKEAFISSIIAAIESADVDKNLRLARFRERA